jgi:anaphase-promoting complex subunit 4
VTSGLENIKRLVHENMLPALERCSVILSRFAGIAKFQGSNDSIGFSSHQISLMMDTVACLNLVCSKILVQAVDELGLFTSFSAWLRYEIDRLVSDPSLSSANDEAAEKEGSIDHSKVLYYIRRTMTTSPLAVYFGPVSEVKASNWVNEEQGLPMFNLLDSQLQKQEQGLTYMQHLPRVDFLCDVLAQQATTIFSQIAAAEKRNVLLGRPEELGIIENDGVCDMKMSPRVCTI